jgi:hypothetical protein
MLSITTRANVFKDILIGWRRPFVIIAESWTIYSIVKATVSPNTPPFPHIPAWLWGLIAMAILLGFVLEGAYRLVRKTKDNWIDNYKYEYGKLPPLPKGLEEMFINYKSGEPISKSIKPITPSKQGWNYRMSPTLKKQWKETIIWLGKNPDDILWEMQKG